MATPIKLKNWAVEYRYVPELEAKGFPRHAVIRDPKDPDFILVRRNYHEFLLYRVSGKKFNYPVAEFEPPMYNKPQEPEPIAIWKPETISLWQEFLSCLGLYKRPQPPTWAIIRELRTNHLGIYNVYFICYKGKALPSPLSLTYDAALSKLQEIKGKGTPPDVADVLYMED